jgi:hypothetical protein
MVVTENHPQLLDDIETVCALEPIAVEQRTAAATRDLGHGPLEQRALQTRPGRAGSSAWPGLAQVLQWECQSLITKTREGREAGLVGGTSLAPERADAARWLALIRGQWQIEHQAHRGREVTFEAAHSQVRCGHIPQVTAALRNMVIRQMRWAGHANMAAAC